MAAYSIARGRLPEAALSDAIKFVNLLSDQEGFLLKDVKHVGHSAGEVYSDFFAIRDNSISVGFSGPSFGNFLNEIEQKYGVDISNRDFDSNVTRFVIDGDLVSNYGGETVGREYRFKLETTINAIVNNKEACSRIVSDFKKANPLARKAIATDAANGNFSNEYDYFIKTETPKYIISGDQDISINSGYLQKITDDCNGSCNLIVFENCGHYPSIKQPEKFNNTINKIATQLFN